MSWLPKQEVVLLLHQQSLRGRMGFLHRTHTTQLSGNPTFIIPLTLISFSGSAPVPFALTCRLWAPCPSQPSRLWTKTNSTVFRYSTPWQRDIHTACLPWQIMVAVSKLAPGHRDHGSKMCGILFWQMLKCDGGVERLFIVGVNSLGEREEDEGKTHRENETAGEVQRKL